MPSGAANGIATGQTRTEFVRIGRRFIGNGTRGSERAAAAMQPMWTRDTHAPVPEPACR